MEEKRNLIVELTFDFALEVIAFCEKLEEMKKYVVAKQLLRCGTSVGANVWESQSAESKADFIHKMKIAAKEALETRYWLLLSEKSPQYPSCALLIEQILVIEKVLSKIISSSKKPIK